MNESTDCIVDPGATPGEYTRVRSSGKGDYAHRVAWIEANGPIPPGLVIRHRCDNPPCRNVAHLLLGTHADNVADMVSRGRNARGEDHGMAKLAEDEVRRIILAVHGGGTVCEVAAQFGVHNSLVSLITTGKAWRPVLDELGIPPRPTDRRKLNDGTEAIIRQRYATGSVSQIGLSREYGVSQRTIQKIIKGRRH
ncbi:hypothetical protein RVR_4506 [Actinacidiphila reveromycinica]|uniref:HNH nuclease domain-containing protein n=1 Tax=Actinacidiphila reveromycinica TaxID=659352 RepID=A0A7U3UTJ0_9ACTN|nr:HNH endonuclease [Streptomyces sp. SN-593]BBA98356.1 hypothetical protein RVR_4506 [Streptomyces sp. SN-593]